MTPTDPNSEELKSFMECQLLKSLDLHSNSEEFSVTQEELVLVSHDLHGENPSGKVNFGNINTEYSCLFKKSRDFNPESPALIICIKDNVKLLEYTLDNLRNHKVEEYANVIIVDDRPSSVDIENLSQSRNYSYLKVSYEEDFSFSMLNNIPAKIAKDLGCSKIILWNSDMWAHKDETLPELIKLHDENQAQISGTKLVYPPFRWDENEDREGAAIPKFFPHKSQTYRGTTQFGGVVFTASPGVNTFVPQHAYRFINPNHPLVNCDKGELCLTGAFMIIELDWFTEQGGFNPSLRRIYQDIDLCLKADRVLYFGKDKFFYHDESLSTLAETEKAVDEKMLSDNLIYAKLWPADFFNKMVQV